MNQEKSNELQKKTKELNLKNIATDVNGNPFPIKNVNVDKLAELFLSSKTWNIEKNELVNQRNPLPVDLPVKKTEKETVKEKQKLNLNLAIKTYLNKNPELDKAPPVIQEKQMIFQPAGSNFE